MTAPVYRLRAGDLHWRQTGDEVVVLDVTTSRYLAVNATGAALWPLLERGASREALSDELVQRWQLDPERAERDVGAFLDWLQREGLLASPA